MARSPWPRRKRSTKPEADLPLADLPERPELTGSFVADGAPTPRRSSPRKIALDLLARREHSLKELKDKLRLRECTDDEIEATLAALVAEGLLSEARFIESFVGSHARRGHGPVWIRAELERRGIAGAVIREALDSAEVDWDAAAEAVRVKRFGPAIPTDYEERARQARFLQYRGFLRKGTGP